MNHQPNTPASLNEAVANERAVTFKGKDYMGTLYECIERAYQAGLEDAAPGAAYRKYTPASKLPSPSGAGLGGAVASSEAVERAAFEKHMSERYGRKPMLWDESDELPDNLRGRYVLRSVQTAWEMWQARAALASQPGCAVQGEALSPATVAQPVAYLHVWKKTGERHVRFEPVADTEFNRKNWQESPLYAGQPCASQGCGGLVERLKQEAQIHAQEARTANSTIAEIYRIVTGGTGEPGNWNGAEPVRKCIEDLRAQVAALSTDKSAGAA